MKSRLIGNKSPLLSLAMSMMLGIVLGEYVVAVVPLWLMLAVRLALDGKAEAVYDCGMA